MIVLSLCQQAGCSERASESAGIGLRALGAERRRKPAPAHAISLRPLCMLDRRAWHGFTRMPVFGSPHIDRCLLDSTNARQRNQALLFCGRDFDVALASHVYQTKPLCLTQFSQDLDPRCRWGFGRIN